MWYPRSAGLGSDTWRLVSSRTQNNTDPHAPELCLTAPTVENGPVRLEICANGSETQAWRWLIDPMSGGNAHPDHPGTPIASLGRPGQCLSTDFTDAQMNEVYVGQLSNAHGKSDGSWVVALFNRTPLPRAMWLELSRLQHATSSQPPPSAWTGVEIWAADGKRELGTLPATQTLRRTVAPHDVALFRLDAAGDV